MQTGWIWCDAYFYDMSTYLSTYGSGNEARIGKVSGAMYFDPKTGAAVTGGWKTVPKLLGSQAREKAFDENENIVPMDNSEKTAKYYFKEDGTIAMDEALEIGGKLYHFNWDGTGTGVAGWADADKTQYRLKSGQLASGRTKVDNLWYFFDPATGRKATRQLRKTGGRGYYYNDLGVQDTVDVDYDLLEQRYTFGSTTGKDLRFVWNKDGSLAKVVYAAGGQPAAGESVSFGYAMEALVAGTGCGFVLDGKGLPLTGVVSGFNPGEGAGSYIPGYFDTCSIVVNADGSRLVCRDDMPSLVKVGSSYYVMNGSLIGAWGEAYAGWENTFDYSRLPAADRALIEQWMTCCNGKLPICVNADGSLPQNTTVHLGWGTVHTTSLGICPEYAGLYKSGSKWYLDTYRMPPGVYNAWDRDSSIMIQIEFRVKDSGELTGVYDYQTGKAITGTYKLDGTNLVIFLKNGKPVTGKQTEPGSRTTFNIPKELGWVSLP